MTSQAFHPGHAVNEVVLRGQVRAYSTRERGPDIMIIQVWSLTPDHRNVWDTIRVSTFDCADPPQVEDWVDVRAQVRRRPQDGVWRGERIVTEGKYVHVVRFKTRPEDERSAGNHEESS